MNERKQYREELLEWCHETAKSLVEQLELLNRESDAYQEEMDVDTDTRGEMEGPFQSEEEYLEIIGFQDEMKVDADQYMDMEDTNKYREDLLEWCNVLYSNWNRTKPRLVNLVDNDSIEGWEELCSRLKEKLQEDQSVDYEDYETANTLYEQWEILLGELHSYQE